MKGSEPIKKRTPIVDGIFYPAEKGRLKETIAQLLETCGTEPGFAFGIVSPHAGLSYSGPYVASAFQSAAKRTIKTAIILAPLHREIEDAIILPESESFATPLGDIAVHSAFIEELENCSTKFYRNDIPHLEEHSIEVQLPFIQYLFPEACIVPILLGKITKSNCRILAQALQLSFEKHYDTSLFVISSNLSSYRKKEDSLRHADTMLELIQRGDWEGIIRAHDSKSISSCGAGCIASLLSFTKPSLSCTVLKRGNSVEQNSDLEQVVEYAGISFNSISG